MVSRIGRATSPFVLAALVACGGSEPARAPATTAAAASSGASTGAPATATAPLPDHVDDLATAIPNDAPLVVLVPKLEVFGVEKATLEKLLPLVAPKVAAETGLPEKVFTAAITSFDGAALFDLSSIEASSPSFAAVVRFQDAQAGEDLIKAMSFQPAGDGRFTLQAGKNKLALAWIPKARVAIVGVGPAVDAAVDALAGKHPSFAAASVLTATKKPTDRQLFLFADLHRLIPNEDAALAEGSQIVASVTKETSEISFVEKGARVPRYGNVVAPIAHDALGKLPGTPAAALELSMARMPGKTIGSYLAELGRMKSSPELVGETEKQLDHLAHLSLADVDRMLGDAVMVGAYVDPKSVGGGDPTKALESGAVIGAVGLRDVKVARAVFDALKKVTAKDDATWTQDKVVVTDKKGKGFVVRLTNDAAVFGAGRTADVEKRLGDFVAGASPFSKTPAFASYTAKSTPSQLSLFVDPAFLKQLAPKEQQGAFSTEPIAMDLVLTPSDDGLNMSLRGSTMGTAAIVGTLAALGIYGTRTYLASAKSSEAKNTIGAIARSAQAGYEREQAPSSGPSHRLCPTAKPTNEVPHGGKVVPDAKIFEKDPGWSCLKFELQEPVRYQYEYRQGGPYKCTKRGGTDPGPNGFEASAEGDLNGDGKTSLFCIVGKVDKDEVRVSTQVEVFDELE